MVSLKIIPSKDPDSEPKKLHTRRTTIKIKECIYNRKNHSKFYDNPLKIKPVSLTLLVILSHFVKIVHSCYDFFVSLELVSTQELFFI